MTIEQEIFARKRFVTDLLEPYGFESKGECYTIEKDFMDGDFTAHLMVYSSGDVKGRVFDNMNDEEYVQLRMVNYFGSYVNSVREAYRELLQDIADKCCTDVSFTSDQSNRISAGIYERYGINPDFPFSDDRNGQYGVFRHPDNNKWFAIIMNIDKRLLDKDAPDEMTDVVNLKIDPVRRTALHKIKGIYPAYHMNHDKWISVLLGDELRDDDIMQLVDDSFCLTRKPAGTLDESLIRQVLGVADSVPSGNVVSYGQIAAMIGRPKNSRLVGKIMSMADRYGDHPCHRVVNHAGRTVPGWTEQRALLEAEGVEFKPNGCVDMKRFQIDTFSS